MENKIELNKDTVICRSPWTPFRILEGEAIIVHSRTRGLHKLNETATEIWQFVEQPKTIAEIVAHLSSEFEIPSDAELFNDVSEFVLDQISHDVLRIKE